jgi:hypothetical protein
MAIIRDRFDKNFKEKGKRGFVRHVGVCIVSKAYKELWPKVGE